MINVAIVEDNDATRQALETMLNDSGSYRCVSSHASVDEAIKYIPRSKTRVVIVDLHLGKELAGIRCIRQMLESRSDLAILAYTFDADIDTIFQALQAGASGYILKRNQPGEIFQAIEDVVEGGAPMSRAIARKVLQFFRTIPAAEPHVKVGSEKARKEFSRLTAREQEILQLVAVGYLDKQIADQLKISLGTVRKHLQRIYEKLHVNSRSQAIAKALG